LSAPSISTGIAARITSSICPGVSGDVKAIEPTRGWPRSHAGSVTGGTGRCSQEPTTSRCDMSAGCGTNTNESAGYGFDALRWMRAIDCAAVSGEREISDAAASVVSLT
jgi:hypothetical protein